MHRTAYVRLSLRWQLRLCLTIVAAGMGVSALLAAAPSAFSAPDFPDHAVKVVVPVLPGAAADILPRIVAERLSKRFGQPVLIENRPGANGNLGAESVARAQPDGYTLLATPPSPLVVNQDLYSRLGFDPAAFVPVTIIASLPNVLVARPDAPFDSLGGLIAFAKAHPNRLTYASAGLGSSPHLAMEWLKHVSGTEMTQVPYNGLAPALNDVVAGHVDLMFNNSFNTLPLVGERRLQALAVDTERRIPELPSVPAVAETFPGFVVTTWFAFVAPPKTPAGIVEKLSSAIASILEEPEVAGKFHALSAAPVGNPPHVAAAFIGGEAARWHGFLERAGLKAE